MITRIQIQNFKSLRDVTVDLNPLTVLIGRSGSGKSNFVHAIRFLRDYISGGNPDGIGNGAAWERILCANHQGATTITFQVEFRLPGFDKQFAYRLELAPANPEPRMIFQHPFGVRLEQLRYGDRTFLAHAGQKWTTAPEVVRLPHPHGVTVGQVYGISEIQYAFQFLTKGIGCYDFPSSVLQAKKDAKGRSANELGPWGMEDDAGNFRRIFESISNDLTSLDNAREVIGALRKINPSVRTVQLENQQNGDLLVGHAVSDKGAVLALTLAQESEGFRRFFAHLLALYQIPPKQTLVFEEPEKGVYPGAFSTLAEFFKTVSSKSQIILTTHSPQLLDYFAPESIRVVEMAGFDTRIGPLAAGQVGAIRDSLLTTGELLTVDEPQMESEAPEVSTEA